MTYRVTVNGEDATAATWTDVRATVGDRVELALSQLPDAGDAYVMDVPQLNSNLTNPQTQEAVDTLGSWRADFLMAPVSVTIIKEG